MLQTEEPGWKSESLPLSLENRCYLNINSSTWIFISCSDNIISRALRCRNRHSRSCPASHIKGEATMEQLWRNARAGRSPGPEQTECSVRAQGRGAARPEQPRPLWLSALGKETRSGAPEQTPPGPCSARPGCHSPRGKGHWQHD